MSSPNESPQRKTDDFPSSSSNMRPNSADVAVRFIPIAVSERQRTNHKGRTICKVVGCSKVDFSYTNGFCKQHFGLFSQGTTVYGGGIGISEPWNCVCGHIVAATKKRCGSCSKWRGGSKGPVKSGGDGAVGNGIVPKPKKPRANKPKKLPDASSLPKLPKPKIVGVKSAKSKTAAQTESKNSRESTADKLISIDEDIAKVRTAKECAQRWSVILMARDQRRDLDLTNHDNNNETDPFDCSDLVVPPNAEIVELEVSKAVQRWKDLDSRLVMEEEEEEFSTVNDDTSGLHNNPLIVDGTMAGDGRRQRLLPPNFDYKCERTLHDNSGQDADANTGDAGHQEQNYYRPKVVSLVDPAQTLDYESELWQVFHSMPKASDLEKKYGFLENARMGNNNLDDGPHGCRHTLHVKDELKKLLSKHTRMDAHSLGRLRVRDRHSIPMSLTAKLTNNHTLHPNSISEETHTESCLASHSSMHASIRFEILRHSVNLKRGSGRDANRLEVELSGSHHTLLDLHRVLVECADTAEGISSAKVNNSGSDIPAGAFFIENNFYTHGVAGEEAGRSIIGWLDGNHGHEPAQTGGERAVSAAPSYRRKHLCVSSLNAIRPMSEAYLENLPLRIGIRYVHMLIDQTGKINLLNESALFVTDIHTHENISSNGCKSRHQLISTAPTIHDTWAPLKPASSCSACNSAVASVVTINDELTDLSSTITSGNLASKSSSSSVEFQGVSLCASCFRDLHYRAAGNGKDELREGLVHQSHKAFAINECNKLMFAMANEKTPDSAMF